MFTVCPMVPSTKRLRVWQGHWKSLLSKDNVVQSFGCSQISLPVIILCLHALPCSVMNL